MGNPWEIVAMVILIIIGLILAPFMTIGVIFIMAGGAWKILGFISIVIGIIRMVGKLNS